MKRNLDDLLKREWSPFPGQFSFALCDYKGQIQSLPSPFTPAWKQAWAVIAVSKWKEALYPGALERLKSFENRNGFDSVKRLADRGADPNFILSLLVKYLWNERVSAREHQQPSIKVFRRIVQGVRDVHFYYDEFYKKPSQPDYGDRKELPLSGEPKEEIEQFLTEVEEKIKRYLESRDFRDSQKGYKPDDKVNRTIFTLHEYLRQTCGPRWADFLKLLLAAEAIEKGVKKKRTTEEEVTDNPDSRIAGHIKSLRRDHPKEAVAIEKAVIPSFIKTGFYRPPVK